MRSSHRHQLIDTIFHQFKENNYRSWTVNIRWFNRQSNQNYRLAWGELTPVIIRRATRTNVTNDVAINVKYIFHYRMKVIRTSCLMLMMPQASIHECLMNALYVINTDVNGLGQDLRMMPSVLLQERYFGDIMTPIHPRDASSFWRAYRI